uniref:DMT family transporter n=1 Tax=uncultured Granulicatella sp. TaxID=316089 RepID=UPI0028DD406B
IVLAMAGTFLIATHGQWNQLSVTPLGLFWGIFSAFTYAIYIKLPIKLIQTYGSLTVIGVGMVIAGGILFPMSGLTTLQLEYSVDILAALTGIILIGTVISYTMFLKGTSYIGPVKSSLIAAVEPISAVFFAFLIMNEYFYAIDFVGMAMILGAVVLISVRDLLKERRKVEQGIIE